MARRRTSGFYDTIEYIGQRPQKPRRTNVFGGWVILLITGIAVCWFGRTLLPSVRAAGEGGTVEQADQLTAKLEQSPVFGDRLAAAALAASKQSVTFDNTYYTIAYPNGDLPAHKGNAEDLVIRCYRKLGIDLQQVVHEDMARGDFTQRYPQLWQSTAPDKNIDHRRALNLQRFFSHQGAELKATRKPADYLPGDVVIWSINKQGETHIGIVAPSPDNNPEKPWVVHCNASGMKWEDCLLNSQIIGHCRYGK